MTRDPHEAPLVSIPQARAPLGGGAEWVQGRGGARLRAALFSPPGAVRGSVVLSPGRTEPIEKYFEVVGELQARGFVVLVHDWRGQGLSGRLSGDPLKGHARGWRWFLGDFDRLLEVFAERLPQPWIAVGHSMGGGLTALALSEGERRFAGAVLSAPMLGLQTGARSPALSRRWARLQTQLGRGGDYAQPQPSDPLDEMFQDNVLTHDRARWERFRAQLLACPDLRLGSVTWGWAAFALTLVRRIEQLRGIEALDIPLTIVAAQDERLCDNAASRAVAARAPQGRYVEAPGSFHEVLMETDARRAVFWREFDALAEAVIARPAARLAASAQSSGS